MNLRAILAVFKRNFRSQFGSPTAYVFIVLFIAATGYFAFVQNAFFRNNAANLDLLNSAMPLLLLFFVPAITMGTWAEEKKQGTDELLFTLPIRDSEAVLGKFLAALGVYTVALFFTLGHALTLAYLGDPDWGQIFAGFLGYWFLGAALISVGMFASTLSNNVTVGFILGAFLCAIMNFVGYLSGMVQTTSEKLADLFNAASTSYHFMRFGDGLVPVRDLVYFVVLTGFVLYLNVVVMGSRHTRFGGTHAGSGLGRLLQTTRIVSIILIIISVNVLASRSPARMDMTEEQLQTLSPDTLQIVDNIPPDRPVFIQAFISPEVPKDYVDQRNALLRILREFDSRGGDRVRVKIHQPLKYSEEATIAEEQFGIKATPVPSEEAGRMTQEDVFMGLVVTSGLSEQVIPFFNRGLSVEYELVRTIRTVSSVKKKVVGIMETAVKMNGGYNFQTRRPDQPWEITKDLGRQYEVRTVPQGAKIPSDIDVLLVPMPDSLTDENLYYVHEFIISGSPALLLLDPFPTFDVGLMPKIREQEKLMQRNEMGENAQGAEIEGDINLFLNAMGVSFDKGQISWDLYNPHRNLPRDMPKEIVFFGKGYTERTSNSALEFKSSFNVNNPITSGLQDMVTLYPGCLKEYSGHGGNLTVTPLLNLSGNSGALTWEKYLGRSFLGPQIVNPPSSEYRRNPLRSMVAAQIQGTMATAYPNGKPKKAEEEEGAKKDKEPAEEEKKEEPAGLKVSERPINVIVVADLDFVGDSFYNLRAMGVEELNFDNVTFISNCIDVLAGDESFVELRKRRPIQRTLTTLDLRTFEFEKAMAEKQEEAEASARSKIAEAQDKFNQAVQAVQQRTDLDQRAKDVVIKNTEGAERKRLDLQTARINADKDKTISIAYGKTQQDIHAVQNGVKFRSIILPPIPALILSILIFIRKRRREQQGIPESRVRR